MSVLSLAILLAQAGQEAAKQPMDSNLVWQYTAVGAVFTALGIWLVIKMHVKSRNPGKGSGGCCGCALSESCKKRRSDFPARGVGKH